MVNYVVLAGVIAFAVCCIVTPLIIPYLVKLKFGNTERAELKSHYVKNGTPTMGGIAIILGILAGSIGFIGICPNIVPVLILTIGFGIIGFIDDFLKVVKKNPDGLIAWQKFLMQCVVAGFYAFWVLKFTDQSLEMLVPFTDISISFGVFDIPILIFLVVGFDNGVNLTDGVDGLLSRVTVAVSLFFLAVCGLENAGIGPVIAAVIGALAAFLIFNVYPAKIFMGDTGSLALGGFVMSVAYLTKMPLYMLLVGLVYWVETASVILQVVYFKATHGKRLFKMAPIHHHFELCGWSEVRVVQVFTVATAFMCVVAFMAYTNGFNIVR